MKTKLIQRLKNIWRLGEEKETLPEVISETPKSYRFEGKPQAKIIKRQTLEQEVEDILKE
jgi:hypothetical protein